MTENSATLNEWANMLRDMEYLMRVELTARKLKMKALEDYVRKHRKEYDTSLTFLISRANIEAAKEIVK